MNPSPPKLVVARPAVAPPLLLVLLSGAVFARTLGGDFVWDDWLVLVRNGRLNPPTLAGVGYYWTHPAWNLYMPVACTGWGALAGLATPLNPAIFHAANVLLQAAVSLGVYRLLTRLVETAWAAAAGAALFAVHPIQVEVVSFIGALNTLLCAALVMGSLCDSLDSADPGARSRGLLMRSSVLLLLATLCKPIAVVTPILALVMNQLRYPRPWRAAVRGVLPLMLAVLPCLVWTMLLQPPQPLTATHVPIAFRPVIAADAVAQYVRLIAWPARLCVDYGRTPSWLYAHPLHAADGLLTVGLLAFAWTARRRWPFGAAAVALFLAGFVPVCGLVPFDFQQYSTVGDRYAYLSMLGPSLALAGLLGQHSSRRHLPVTIAATVLLLTGLAVASVRQTQVWRNDQTLFGHVIAVNPRSWLGHENLAVAELRNDPAAAVAQARLAIGLRPDVIDAYQTLGQAFLELHRPADAASALESGVPHAPRDARTRLLLATALEDAGGTEAAIGQYREILRFDPSNADAETNLGADLAELHYPAEALLHYRRAIQLNPQSPAARAGVLRLESAGTSTP